MKTFVQLFLLPVLLWLPTTLWAQGSIFSNTGSFTLQNIPTSPLLDSADADFIPQLGTDHVSEQWWWFRLPGDTRETPFHASMTGFTQSYGANFATLTFNQPGVFNGTMRYFMPNVLNFVFGESIVNTEMQIENVSGAPLILSVFNYLDFDVHGPGGDSAFLEAPFAMRVDDGGINSPFGRYRAPGASSYLAGPSVIGELGLFNNVVTLLSD